MSECRYLIGDTRDVVAAMPAGSVDLVLTSPPFLALRSYLPADHPDKGREIGSEPTPADFLDTLLDLTEAWARVLAPHGSICVELGDTYSGSGGSGGDYCDAGLREGQARYNGSGKARGAKAGDPPSRRNAIGWPESKSLCGIPTLYAWSLAYGRNLLRPERTTEPWRVRNVVAWCRPNPPVGALGDKFRPATSYMTIACKARDRYFDLDAVRTPLTDPSADERFNGKTNQRERARADAGLSSGNGFTGQNPAGAPPLDWWEISTEPYAGSHYATWPRQLLVRPIKAMCPERVCRVCGQPSRRITERSPEYAAARDAIGDFNQRDRQGGEGVSGSRSVLSRAAGKTMTCAENVTLGWSDCGHNDWRPGHVLDPFAGSGTTLAVASGNGRDATGIDIDARNADLARCRVGMFLTVEGEADGIASVG